MNFICIALEWVRTCSSNLSMLHRPHFLHIKLFILISVIENSRHTDKAFRLRDFVFPVQRATFDVYSYPKSGDAALFSIPLSASDCRRIEFECSDLSFLMVKQGGKRFVCLPHRRTDSSYL